MIFYIFKSKINILYKNYFYIYKKYLCIKLLNTIYANLQIIGYILNQMIFIKLLNYLKNT